MIVVNDNLYVFLDSVWNVEQSEDEWEGQGRAAVAASLGADAKKYIENIQDTVAQLDAKGETPDHTMPGPIVHSKGMSF